MTRRMFFGIATALALLSPASAQTRHEEVIYGHKMGVALSMDVTLPEKSKSNGIGVLWMVSGGWVSSHSSINPALGKAFADRGYTLFQVVHGTAPKFTLPEILQDINRSVRFVRTNASRWGVNPDKLGISGGSAGGHLTCMMAAYGGPGDPNAKDVVDRASSAVQCAACFYPPTDFLNYGKDDAKAMLNPFLKGYWPAFGITEKTPPEEIERLSKTLSPIYGITKTTCPVFLIHGTADLLVPIQQSERLIAKLKEEGVPCELVKRPGKGHGWPGIEKDAELLMDWFDKYLTSPRR
ncbi:MAG: alpha/beta hydrolase [Armatimonadetes bacterium]|nr:alpha/beta hydrolase [Armatimonadota bacterium]